MTALDRIRFSNHSIDHTGKRWKLRFLFLHNVLNTFSLGNWTHLTICQKKLLGYLNNYRIHSAGAFFNFTRS